MFSNLFNDGKENLYEQWAHKIVSIPVYNVLLRVDFVIAIPMWTSLKCICNENFGFGIFVLSENFIFSDHFDTNLVENFELEDCEFLV